MLRRAPADLRLSENKKCKHTQPNRLRCDCPCRKGDGSDKADDTRDFQTTNRAEPKPKQTANDLSTIERINREEIEEKQKAIDKRETENELEKIGRNNAPVPVDCSEGEHSKDWK